MTPAKTHLRGRRSGFTLVEAITGILVLSISVPPMLWAVRHAHTHRVNRMLASRAHWLAVEKLEDVAADRNSTTRGYAYLVTANYPAESSITGFPGFTRTVTLQETAADLATAGTGFMKATVTVSYTDDAAAARSLALTTVLTNYTP